MDYTIKSIVEYQEFKLTYTKAKAKNQETMFHRGKDIEMSLAKYILEHWQTNNPRGKKYVV